MLLDGIEVNLAGLLGMVAGNDDLGEVPALGVRYRCRCNKPDQEEVRTLRIFLTGDQIILRCWACGWTGGVLEFAFKVMGARTPDDEANVIGDRFLFPEGVEDSQLEQLRQFRRAMRGFNQWRSRLRFEASPSGAVRLPHYLTYSAWGWEVGFGDFGLALPSELAHCLPGTPHPKRWGRLTFVRVVLMRGIFGQPARIIILDPALADQSLDLRLCGVQVDLAPTYKGPLFSAPRSIEWADIGSRIALTANPSIAVDLLRQMIKNKADLWSEIPRVDPDRRPDEHGLPIALLHMPSRPVGALPFEKVVFAHRPGDVPDVALALDDPTSDVRLHEHSDGDRFDLDSLCHSPRGESAITEAYARSLRLRAEDEQKCPFRVLREISTQPYFDQSMVAAVAGNIADAVGGDPQAELDALQLEEARFLQIGDTRYRCSGRRYFRTSPRRKPIAISNFCMRILEDRIDTEGLLSSHVLRLVMGKRFVDFEISNDDFENADKLWAAIRSVAASHYFPEYPSVTSAVERKRLPQIVLATQAPVRQVKVGEIGFSAGGSEFNFETYSILRSGVVRRCNVAPGKFVVVGADEDVLPDLGAQRRCLRRWMNELDVNGRTTALLLLAAVVAWLHRGRMMRESFVAFQSKEQLEFVSSLLGVVQVGKGRATGHDAGLPKVLAGKGRPCCDMAAHGKIVAGLSHRDHWDSGRVTTVVTAAIPEMEPIGSGILPAILHACIRTSTADEALQFLCSGAGGAMDVLVPRGPDLVVAQPGRYIGVFFAACRQVGVGGMVKISGSRRLLPIDVLHRLADSGYVFERRRVSHELRKVHGLSPYFYGAAKLPTWELPPGVSAGDLLPEPEPGRRRPGTRERAAFCLGVVHAFLEWTNPVVVARELRDDRLRQKYAADANPDVRPARRISQELRGAYLDGYQNMALNCAARTTGCQFVTSQTSSFFSHALALDYDRRLAVFLGGDPAVLEDDGAKDPHFRRTLENLYLLEAGAKPPPGIRGHSSPVGGIHVSRL